MIDEFIDENYKYHFYITSTNKTIFLSSDDNKKEASEQALKKLAPNIDNLIGKKLVLVKIKSVENKFNTQNENNDLKLIGGPIMIEIGKYIILNSTKINSKSESGPKIIFLSKKFIKKNLNTDITPIIKDLVTKYMNNKLNSGLFNMNIL